MRETNHTVDANTDDRRSVGFGRDVEETKVRRSSPIVTTPVVTQLRANKTTKNTIDVSNKSILDSHWIIVKINVNGTIEPRDNNENFAPIVEIFPILRNHTNPDNTYRELSTILFDDDHRFESFNETTIEFQNPNLIDKTLIGHIVFFVFVDIVAIIGICMIGLNYVNFFDMRNMIEERFDDV